MFLFEDGVLFDVLPNSNRLAGIYYIRWPAAALSTLNFVILGSYDETLIQCDIRIFDSSTLSG